ncbi:hypothetical protein U1Q18_032846, partial [Sarracenia purpurea var. burkii]
TELRAINHARITQDLNPTLDSYLDCFPIASINCCHIGSVFSIIGTLLGGKVR